MHLAYPKADRGDRQQALHFCIADFSIGQRAALQSFELVAPKPTCFTRHLCEGPCLPLSPVKLARRGVHDRGRCPVHSWRL